MHKRGSSPASRRSDDAEAFIHDPAGGPAHTRDDLAEELAEEFLASATSAQEVGADTRAETFAEEIGGPFVTSRMSAEFGYDRDSTNPEETPPEPLPAAMRSYADGASREPAVTEELPRSSRRRRRE